jgi:hypothetical protein
MRAQTGKLQLAAKRQGIKKGGMLSEQSGTFLPLDFISFPPLATKGGKVRF